MEFNPQLQLAGLLEWMHTQLEACHGRTAVIGISGGKDSSTVAALAAAAYGRERVYGVLMPDGVQPDIDYSQALVEHLRIPHCTINIHDAVQGVMKEMARVGLTPSRQTTVNLPSRIRMSTLYAVAQSLDDGVVINTSNRAPARTASRLRPGTVSSKQISGPILKMSLAPRVRCNTPGSRPGEQLTPVGASRCRNGIFLSSGIYSPKGTK